MRTTYQELSRIQYLRTLCQLNLQTTNKQNLSNATVNDKENEKCLQRDHMSSEPRTMELKHVLNLPWGTKPMEIQSEACLTPEPPSWLIYDLFLIFKLFCDLFSKLSKTEWNACETFNH